MIIKLDIRPWGFYWRMWGSLFFCLIVLFFIWSRIYPEAFWFLRLWSSLITGTFCGCVIGTVWHLWKKDRQQKTPGTVGTSVAIGIAFAGLLSLLVMTTMRTTLGAQQAELKKVRTIAKEEILAVEITTEKKVLIRIDDKSSLSDFVKCLEKSRIFAPSHEGASEKLRIEIECKGKAFGYNAWVPERHQNSICLSFDNRLGQSRISVLVPGLKVWLDRCSCRKPRSRVLLSTEKIE